ncbi:MAG: hypothetical protein FJ011_25920 [Chloroflexi bacterium]|nr:hypothetical protein [Chloroflexota bacterium]
MDRAMIPYDQGFSPPAPVLQVTITNCTQKRRWRTMSALVDTGSDISAVPRELAHTLQLYPVGRLRLEDVQARVTIALTYVVQLTVAGLVIPRLEVILTGLSHVVLGRDALAEFCVLLRGPEQTFDMGATLDAILPGAA